VVLILIGNGDDITFIDDCYIRCFLDANGRIFEGYLFAAPFRETIEADRLGYVEG
jgi:hypothetical protein